MISFDASLTERSTGTGGIAPAVATCSERIPERHIQEHAKSATLKR
jgi:hypothetical protein